MDSGNYRVLIAEDDYINSLFLKSLLKKAGYEVREARDGNQVLAELEKGDTDLLLLDYNLPGKNGAEVVKIMRKNNKLKGESFFPGILSRKKRLLPEIFRVLEELGRN